MREIHYDNLQHHLKNIAKEKEKNYIYILMLSVCAVELNWIGLGMLLIVVIFNKFNLTKNRFQLFFERSEKICV